MPTTFLPNPLPAKPVPCGRIREPSLVASWQSPRACTLRRPPKGPGLAAVAAPRTAFAASAFTLEMWLAWPRRSVPLQRPATLAEAAGRGWSWRLSFDHAGALRFVWTFPGDFKLAAGDIMIDSLLPGTWYHVAVTLGGGQVTLYVTPAGCPVARRTGPRFKFDPPADGFAGKRGKARLAIGRPLARADEPSPLVIHSAAFHDRALGCGAFHALGGAKLPRGLRIDARMEYGSVGRVFALSPDTIAYTVGPRDGSWTSFRVRGARRRTLTFVQLPRGGQGMFVSEDGGRTWDHPSGGTWRRSETTDLSFTHTFAADEAVFATTPPVTNAMADAWLDRAARRLGHAHPVTPSPFCSPVRRRGGTECTYSPMILTSTRFFRLPSNS